MSTSWYRRIRRTSHRAALTVGLAWLLVVLTLPLPANAGRLSSADLITRQVLAPLGPLLSSVAAERRGLAWAVSFELPVDAGPKTRLLDTLQGLVAGRLGQLPGLRMANLLPSPPGTLPSDLQAGARAAGADFLLVVDGFVKQGHVHLTSSVHRIHRSFWSQIREPIVGIRSHAYGSARLDAEFRALLDIVVAPAAAFELIEAPVDAGVLAATSADVDGDGLTDIVALTEESISVFGLGPRQGRLAQLDWTDVPAAVARPRDSFAHVVAADITGDGLNEIIAWISTRQHALALGWRHGELRRIPLPSMRGCGPIGAVCGVPIGALPPLGDARNMAILLAAAPVDGLNHFPAKLAVWSAGAAVKFERFPGLYWTMASLSLVTPTPGQHLDLTAAVDRRDQVVIRSTAGNWTVADAGSAIALTDFEDDGIAELVRSSNTLEAPDVLSVHRLTGNGETRQIWRRAVDPVRSVTAGDFTGDGRIEALILTRGPSWLLRPKS